MKSLSLFGLGAWALVCFPACALNFDSDISSDLKSQMQADLAMMGTVQASGVSPLHSGIFGPVDGKNYVQWFDSRAKSVGKSTCGSDSAVACVIPFLDSSKIWITDNYIKFSHPQISRLMVVYHEARHTEDAHGNWPHANCPTPFRDDNGHDMMSIWTGAPLAGESACDVTPQGSYGSSMILLKNIAKFCTTCGDKVKLDAGIYADDQYGRITDDSARTAIANDLYDGKILARKTP